MVSLKIASHFFEAEWPIVNKIRAISTCAQIDYEHSPTADHLDRRLEQVADWEKVLLISDEAHISLLKEIEKKFPQKNIETLMFLDSNIADVAGKVTNLKTVKHLVGSKKYELLGKDLAILIKKISHSDLLNLDKYLSFGADIKEKIICSNKSKLSTVSEVYNYIYNLGDDCYSHPFGEYARRISEIADELILNAIFSSNTKRRLVDRTKDFQLSDHEEVKVTWGFDGEYFGLSVVDQYGDFSKNTMLQYLDSNRKIGNITHLSSGGLGFKMIFKRTHQLIVNISPGSTTEVICLTKFESRLKDFDKVKNAMFYFSKESS